MKNETGKKDKTLVSCFDFNHNLDFYLLGTYSKNIYLVDYRTDKTFASIQRHTGGINNLIILQNNNEFLSGGRKDNEVLLWDVRNLDEPVYSFYRNNPSSQKINFTIDDNDKYLFCANYVRYIV